MCRSFFWDASGEISPRIDRSKLDRMKASPTLPSFRAPPSGAVPSEMLLLGEELQSTSARDRPFHAHLESCLRIDIDHLPIPRASFSKPVPSSVNLRLSRISRKGFSLDVHRRRSQRQHEAIEDTFQWRIAPLQYVVIRQNHNEPAVGDYRLHNLQEAAMFAG